MEYTTVDHGEILHIGPVMRSFGVSLMIELISRWKNRMVSDLRRSNNVTVMKEVSCQT